MKRIFISFLGVFLFLHYLQAQFDAQISQYMFHPTALNPAAVGETGMLDVSGQHRLQWIGMPNAGSTTLFNINAPIRFAGRQHGVGINFMNDEVGLFINQGVHLQYAYKLDIGEGALNIGPQLGFLSIGFKGDSVRGPQVAIGDYHDIASDPAIPTTLVEGFGFDMGVGVWYTLHDMYAGFSYTHLNQPVIDWTDEYVFKPASTMYLTGGYSKKLRNPDFTLAPSFLIKTDFQILQFDVSTILHYNDRFWGGASFRYSDAVVFLAGLQIGNGLSIGYSFDLPVSQLITSSWGSHEILLSYAFEVQAGNSSRRKKYKSIRIL